MEITGKKLKMKVKDKNMKKKSNDKYRPTENFKK